MDCVVHHRPDHIMSRLTDATDSSRISIDWDFNPVLIDVHCKKNALQLSKLHLI